MSDPSPINYKRTTPSPGATAAGDSAGVTVPQAQTHPDHDAPVAVGDRPAPADLPRDADERPGERAKRTGREALDEVRDFTDEAQRRAGEQWHEARRKFGEARQHLAEQFGQQRGKLNERVRGFAGEQKKRVAGGVGDASAAARAAAEKLRERDDATVAGYAEAAADQLDRVRDYFEHADVGDLMRDAAGVTKRHPEWVLGGAFVVGLALSRFLKADDPAHRGHGHRAHSDGPPADASPDLYDDLVRDQNAASDRRSPVGLNDASAPRQPAAASTA